MAPSAALYLAILLLAGNCAHAAGGEPPGQELEWMPGCKEAAEAQLAEMQAGVPQNGTQLLFLGDSITEIWRGTLCGKPCHPAVQLNCPEFAGLMQRYFGQYSPAVQAIAGDQVANLMWRIQNGALPNANQTQPKVAVLLIGINDLSKLGHNAPGIAPTDRQLLKAAPTVATRQVVTFLLQYWERIEEAVGLLQERLPRTQIVLLGLLPAGTWGLPGAANYSWPSKYSRALPVVNTRLRAYAAGQPRVQYLDCGARFLVPNGTAIDPALMPDALHPSAAGMERGIAQCIKPLVDLLMQIAT
ncbi:hypothetical protein COHA_008966 [Chlorella ohadii]|uniref:SGNH hydrolase-type esterase domain-containing protein n=1 Tax=Chlorella ohadii TaxID=2649997 RepID=A0AAD5DIW7_9CHLO|nr:hypothetical protein COHA_008966 [Chlorella ohadii]